MAIYSQASEARYDPYASIQIMLKWPFAIAYLVHAGKSHAPLPEGAAALA